MHEIKRNVRVAASIVTYKSDIADVRLAVRSFLNAKLKTQLTIVDNNSGASYYQALQHYLPNVKFIQTGCNKGFGFGHNIAIACAPYCDYYLVLNPDVEIPNGTLEAMVAFLDQHSDIGLLSPRIIGLNGDLQHLNKRLPTVLDLALRRFVSRQLQSLRPIRNRMDRYVMKDLGYNIPVRVQYMSGCFMLFRKSVLDGVGGFDENIFLYLEDADITHRVNQISKAMYFPDATIIHRWNRGSHRSIKLTLVNIKSAFYFFRKWGWRLY